MDCTIVVGQLYTHGAWVIQWSWLNYIPMGHGLYNTHLCHDPWVVQHLHHLWSMGYIMPTLSMTHGLYNSHSQIGYPWVMGCC